jgi:hypothetical protein
MRAERQLISEQSDRFATQLIRGPTGDALRKQLAEEFQIMQQLQTADRVAFANNVATLTSFMQTELVTRGPANRLAAGLGFAEQYSQMQSVQSSSIEQLTSQFAIDYLHPMESDSKVTFFDGQQIHSESLAVFRSAVKKKYLARFPQSAEASSRRCNDVTKDGFTLTNWTGVCPQAGGAIDAKAGSYSGSGYYERSNKRGAFVEEVETEMRNGEAIGPTFVYRNCFYPTSQATTTFDEQKCVTDSSPYGVYVGALAEGAMPKAKFVSHAFTNATLLMTGVVDHIAMSRRGEFQIPSGNRHLLIRWSYKGVEYLSEDKRNIETAASPNDRKTLDEAWMAWLQARSALVRDSKTTADAEAAR